MPDIERDDSSESVKTLARREFLRRWARRLVGAGLIALASFGAFRGYRVWQKDHLAKQARAFFAQGDDRSAALVARRMLALDERNSIAWRVMAEIAQRAGRPEALTWFQRLFNLEPKIDNLYALAFAALQFGQIDYAEHLAGTVPANERAAFRAHQLFGAIAVAKKAPANAEMHFAAALRLQPGDLPTQLHLARARLASADASVLAQARRDLARLAGQPLLRLEALRALTGDAVAHHQQPAAERLGKRLISHPAAQFSDRLLHLQACHGTEEAGPALGAVQAKAFSSPPTAAELITWMNRHGLAGDALAWAKTLPPKMSETQPVPLAVAESYSFLQDWVGLRNFVDGKNWDAFESLRLMIASHAARRLPSGQHSAEAETLWRAALKNSQSNPQQIATLAELALGWGYPDQAEEAFWALANSNQNPKAALSNLQRLYQETRNTHGLLRVAKRAYELNPGDLVAANNCASLGLLLSGDASARRLAARLHREHPRHAAFAATYAFALHIEGKTAEGLAILAGLNEEQLRVPAIAAYYFVMLVERGQMERAKPFLSAANKAALLPEEQALLTAATRQLFTHDSNNVTKSVAAAER